MFTSIVKTTVSVNSCVRHTALIRDSLKYIKMEGTIGPTEPVAMISHYVMILYNQTVRNLKWKLQGGGLQTGCAFISVSRLHSTNQRFQSINLCFRVELHVQRNHLGVTIIYKLYNQIVSAVKNHVGCS